MAMTLETKRGIDELSVEALLRDHRFIPSGDSRYEGEEGKYRITRLATLQRDDPEAFTQASKDVGWRIPS